MGESTITRSAPSATAAPGGPRDAQARACGRQATREAGAFRSGARLRHAARISRRRLG
jgi:hypothetical protein